MKRFIVIFIALSFLAASAHAEQRHVNGLTFEAAQKQAYWYSLYNVAHLTMFSGLGEVMKGGGMTGLIEWVKERGVKKAELLKDMTMTSSVYAEGDPRFVKAVDLGNKKTMQWDRAKMNATLEPSAHAFTIIKSVTKNFHRDYHETDLNQRVAIAMYPQAKNMARLLTEKMINRDGLFVAITPDGKKMEPVPFDQIAALWALSDLALISSDPDVPPYNDSNLNEWATKWADRSFNAAKRLPPVTIIEKAIAIEAYGRYAAAAKDKGLRREAIRIIRIMAEGLQKGKPVSITEMGLSVYGLAEAYRVTGDHIFLERALSIFNNEMERLWDEKAGVYATLNGTKKYIYTPFDVGAVLSALNTVLWFAIPSYNRPQDSGPSLAERRYVRFFENAVVLSGMQQSSGVYLVETAYLKREKEDHFIHPSILSQDKAGGGFGIAPVYAGEVTYENGAWRVTEKRFKTMGAMFLANMSVILNRHQADCFIPLERLTARLIADAQGAFK